MKTFLLKTTFFIILFLLPLVALEVYLRNIVLEPFSAKHVILEENLENCETLIMGSSHAWSGLNPEWMGNGKGVNVANSFQPLYYDYKILEKYVPKMPYLNTVILPLSYQALFNLPDDYHESLYHIYWGFPLYWNQKSIERKSLILNFGLKTLRDNYSNRAGLLDHRGWEMSSSTYDQSEKTARKRLDMMHDVMNMKNLPKNKAWLDDIIQLCDNQQIRLIVFIPPFSKEYNDLILNNAYSEKIKAVVKDLKKDGKVELYDFNDNSAFTDSLFRDPDHLNVKGAKLLSSEFDLILANPIGFGK